MSSPRYTNKFNNLRILLIGGTGGVGIAVAQALLEFGAEVILSSSREGKIKQIISDLTAQYPNAKGRISGHVCDLASPSVEDNITALFEAVGKINHMIYLAGDRLPTVPLAEVTLEKWIKASQVRTIASILCAKHAIKHLDPSPNSSITFTGGSIAHKPIPGGWAMLALMGAGINGLTRQLAFDLAPVRVNCVELGIVETDLWEGMGEEGKRAFLSSHAEGTLTKKVGQAGDVAEAYLYLLRDANVTGSVVESNSGTFLV
jgi:NAD(P)-dependent dehydrogenase (short-subunit alcohol dehydrogenase family)